MSPTVTIHYDSRKIRTWNPPRSQPIEIVQPKPEPKTRTVMRPRFMGDDFFYVPVQVPVEPPVTSPSGTPSQSPIYSFLEWLFGK